MEIIYSLKALEDINHWKKTGNKAVQKKISMSINDIIAHPYSGLGKPEAIKHKLSGSWSRRITRVDRLVYRINIENNTVEIETLRGHY